MKKLLCGISWSEIPLKKTSSDINVYSKSAKERRSQKGDKYDEAQDETDNEESDDAKFEISVVDQEVSNEHLWNCFFTVVIREVWLLNQTLIY